MSDVREAAYLRLEAAFCLPMLLLTVAVIPLLAVSLTAHHLSHDARDTITAVDWGVWG